MAITKQVIPVLTTHKIVKRNGECILGDNLIKKLRGNVLKKKI